MPKYPVFTVPCRECEDPAHPAALREGLCAPCYVSLVYDLARERGASSFDSGWQSLS